MKKNHVFIIGSILLLGLSGCGKSEQNVTSYNENAQQIEATDSLEESKSVVPEVVDNTDNDVMYIYSEADTLKDYDTVDKLLDDAYALVKVEVLQANCENVRNYIYTSYDMKILDVVYGAIDEDGEVINVNMPGGIVQGNEAQAMITEVTEGKDAGDLSGINQIISDGNTDRLLSVGDEAYLFLMRESETSFAVVGEYCGEMLLENGDVVFDSNIIGFEGGVSAYGLQGGSMSEDDFVEVINELRLRQEEGDGVVLIPVGDNDLGDAPYEGKQEDYVEFSESEYRVHPITGDVLNTKTNEIIENLTED